MTSARKIAVYAHVKVMVSDFHRSKDFYDRLMKAMGYRRMVIHDWDHYPGWGTHGTDFWIEKASPGRFSENKPGLHHIAFSAPSRAAVDRLGRWLKTQKIHVITGPRLFPEYTRGYYAIFFRDPDGIRLEYAHIPQ